MNDKKVLLEMLKTLYNDISNIQQKGAGYYSTGPFVERYNKLLNRAKKLFSEETDILEIFSEAEDTNSVDPADKSKTAQKVALELNQLITFIKAALEEGP
jgi:hypothetical protein